MAYTVSKLKNDLTRKLHGTSLNKLQDVDGTINEASRQVLQDVDPVETVRYQQITNAIYSQVYDYQLPADVKGNKIIDIAPQTNRNLNDNFNQGTLENFDIRKDNNTFVIKHDSGVKSIRISKNVTTGVTLADMNEVGDWTAAADAENLAQDKQYYISAGASLKFDLDGSTTQGYLENSSLDEQDLSDTEDEGAFFLWVYFPDESIITSVTLRWGNSATAFWDNTVTSNHDSTAFQTGWNLLRFDWDGANETGSPDSSEVDYARITITYDGTADTNLRVDNLVYRLGDIYDISYYSKYIFRTSAGTW